MIYREAGDFKTTYAADNQTFPIKATATPITWCWPSRSA